MSLSQKPLVTVYDPLTWDHDWSYEIERKLLAESGVDFLVGTNEPERDELAARADVVIASSIVPISADVIRSLGRCVGIVCYSAGMDIVEAKAAAEAGIAVGNVNAGTDEVADHAMALLLTAGRMVLPLATATAHHNWDLRDFPDVWTIRRMRGQTLGVVGAGRIGRAVAQRARAFGMNTVATYHQPPNPADPDLPHVVLEDLFERSDAIVVCAALNDETRGLIDSSVLARTKPGAILVNVSRGGLINEDALVDALETGRVRMAALDVRESEPPVPEQDRLTGRSDVIQTPHIGGVSREAAFDLHRLAAETCLRILSESRRL